jgi:hypothetical protein
MPVITQLCLKLNRVVYGLTLVTNPLRNICHLESRFFEQFSGISNCRRIWALLEKVLRFAGFEETKLHYEAQRTADGV